MEESLSRRDFVRSGAAAGLAALVPVAGASRAPAVLTGRVARPLVVSSANGHVFRNGGTQTAVERAFSLISEGRDVLDALIAGVNIVELDPEETSVGYGGLPNAVGVVQLDSCCMHGPRRRAGGVAALEGVRTPSQVARAVMDNTDHVLIVGEGAKEFARNLGFPIEDDLNTPRSRALWLEWKRRTDPQHYITPKERSEAGHRAGLRMVAEGLIDPAHYYGTINCNGINARGEICGVTTTSGWAFKIPGRVGDSPIIGAGLYVDGRVGAAGSTGRGEANLLGLCSYQIVESMRRGMHPKDAGMDALRRVRENTVDEYLLNSKGNPNFGLDFHILDAAGEHAGVSMYPSQYAICTENGAETLATESLLQGREDE
jgi:N4-(beta-N-acetylglucosaminyl)-L-asparaginase